MKRAVVIEVLGYVSIGRYLCRRPKVPAGAVGFSDHKPILPILIVIVSVSAFEVVAVDLVVERWAHVRLPLLIIGFWGLIWMFGLLRRAHASSRRRS